MTPSRRAAALLATALALIVSACAVAPQAPIAIVPVDRREALIATLWMQRSAEFRIVASQVYRNATAKLDDALKPGTAAVEQEGQADLVALPPAVVMDIDETVLDNAPYQAWRLMAGREFEPVSWKQWIHLAKAEAIPGAVEFTRAARARGVHVVYISNRDCAVVRPAPCSDKLATVDNLNRAGFPTVVPDDVLFRGEMDGWDGKEARRKATGSKYRIVMLVGDDLRDLLPSANVTDLRKPGGEARQAAHLARMGERLFLLPNPVYGSWEDALVTERCKPDDAACPARVLEGKYRALLPAQMP